MKGILLHKWVISAFVIIVLSFGFFSYGAAASNFLLGSMTPIVRAAHDAGTALFQVVQVMRQSSQQADAIRALRIQNSELIARVAELEYIRRDNEKLRSALNRETVEMQFVMARVAGRSPSLLQDYLIIDAGAANGIRVGASVLIDGNILIGTIRETAEKSAIVQLLSHAGEKTEIYFLDAQVSSVAIGKGGGLWETQVPESITVREGEPVLSVGPPDFVIGYVEQVVRSDAGPFHIIRSNHPVSLADVRMVFVVK